MIKTICCTQKERPKWRVRRKKGLCSCCALNVRFRFGSVPMRTQGGQYFWECGCGKSQQKQYTRHHACHFTRPSCVHQPVIKHGNGRGSEQGPVNRSCSSEN